MGLLSVWSRAGSLALAILAAAALSAASWWIVAGAGRWVLALLATALLLPPLPLPWGDSGVHPAIFVALLGLWAGAVRPRAWRVRANPIGWALFFLLAALLASVPWAALYSGPAIAGGSLARVGLFAISVYLFFYLAWGPGRALQAERVLRLLFWAGSAAAAFAVVDFLLQLPAPARFAGQFVWLGSGVLRRAQGLFYESSTLGSFCAFLLTLLAVAALRPAVKRLGARPVWLLAAGAVLLAALIFSFSRSAVASLAVAMAALLWMERGRLAPGWKLGRAAAAAALCVCAGVGLVLWLFPEFFNAYLWRLRNTTEFFFSEPNAVLSRRLDGWLLLLDYLRDNPWQSVLGIGYKTLPYTEFLGRPVVADNMYLSLLIETGWPGLGALLLLNAVILFHSYRRSTSAPTETGRFCNTLIFCFWCGQLVQMATGDVLTYWRILPAFVSVMALGARHENPVSGSVQ